MVTLSRIRYVTIDELSLDPLNPRLGRGNTGPRVTQTAILKLMKDWTLDELAVSFIESGFWPQEALLAVEEQLYGRDTLVVIEGNRRLAALKLLHQASLGSGDKKWRDIAGDLSSDNELFNEIPVFIVPDRKSVEAFLGFRHVTGIKEWKPAEKAEYISKLIDESSMSYTQVMRKIGSKTPTVRQNYISYKLLLQMENREDISVENVEEKFSVLFLSLRTSGVQKYLHIDIQAEPAQARRPVPREHLANLSKFALWLFGDDKRAPLVSDSRRIDDFGRILESKKAVDYLERSERPTFEAAFQLAGGDEPELLRLIEQAADNIETALRTIHRYSKSKKLERSILRLGEDTEQLLRIFPSVKQLLEEGTK